MNTSALITALGHYGISNPTEIVYNPSYELLFAEETNPALTGYEAGVVTELGAVAVNTGEFTGRSPKDKYFVKDDVTRDTLWWSDQGKNDNKAITPEVWSALKKVVGDQLSGKRLFIVDLFCGCPVGSAQSWRRRPTSSAITTPAPTSTASATTRIVPVTTIDMSHSSPSRSGHRRQPDPSSGAEASRCHAAAMTTHHYRTEITWTGSTATGYRGYDRTHTAIVGTATPLPLSADPVFGGDPEIANPEQLLAVAASSCQLLSFLAAAARRGIDVRDYADTATATMDDAATPARVDAVALAPVIGVAAGTDHAAVLDAVAAAHERCFVAASLVAEVTVDARVEDR